MSDDSRTAILDAAERLFARQGFEATTIKQLGTEAGVNTALLYYYFQDKTALYRATLQRLIAGFVAEGMRRMDQPAGPEAAIRVFVEGQMAAMLARPNVARILVRELVDHGAEHAEALIAEHTAGMFERLCGVIEAGQRAGVFRRELEPRFAAVSVVSQVMWILVARPAVGILFGHGPAGMPEDVLRAYGRHAADFALAALRAAPLSHDLPRAQPAGREMVS